MRRPLLGLLLASTVLVSTALPARTACAEPPLAPLKPAATAAAPAWAAPLAGTRRRSSGAMIGGIVLAVVGAVAMAAGTAGYAQAVGACTTTSFSGSFIRSDCDNGASKLSGMTTLLVGAAAVSIGVPLWIYGSEKVAETSEDHASKPTASMRIGPTSATLQLSF